MKKLLVLCGFLAALLGVSNAQAYQNDCLASLVVPTWNEQQSVPCSVRLDGGLGMHFLDQLGGEHVDPAEELGYLRTTGAIARSTQLLGTGGVPTTATDATSAIFELPIGTKTFHAVETCTGTCTQVIAIYGNSLNSTSSGETLLCTLTLNTASEAKADCTVTTIWKYFFVVTTGTGGTTPLTSLIAQY